MANSFVKFLSLSLFAAILVLAGGASLAQQPSMLNLTITDAPPISGLAPDHATLSVENLDREVDWYERVLGFKLEQKNNPRPEMMHVRLTIPGYHIDLIKYQDSKRPVAVEPLYLQQGWIHVVFHVDDAAATVKQLQALHVEPKEIDSDKGVPTRILLRDPEDNEIEITHN